MSDLTQAEKNVFGVHAVKDEAGKIIETGVGAVKQFVAGVEAAFDHGPLIAEIADLQTQLSVAHATIADLQAQLATAEAHIKSQADLLQGKVLVDGEVKA